MKSSTISFWSAALMTCAIMAVFTPRAQAAAPDPATLHEVLDHPDNWDLTPQGAGEAWSLQTMDGRQVMAVGPGGVALSSRHPLTGPAEIVAVFRQTNPGDKGSTVGLAVGIQAGVPWYQAIRTGLMVLAGADMNYLYAGVSGIPGEPANQVIYRVWDLPKGRLGYPEMVRLKIEQDVSSMHKLNEKWMTYRVVLQPHAVRIYLDGRLIGNSSGPLIDTNGTVRLQLVNGTQLASLKVRGLPAQVPSRFETVPLEEFLNASKVAGKAVAEGSLPSGQNKAVDGVPFAFPIPDRRGNNHIDLEASWVRAAFIPDGADPGQNDGAGAANRWNGALVPDPSRIVVRVPNARYLNLHLIAAYDGEPNTVPIVTAQFFRTACGHPVNFATRVPLFTAHSGPGDAIPITLIDDSKAKGVKGRLFHVTIPLEPDSLSSLAESDIVEMELTKAVETYVAFPDPDYFSAHGAGLPSGVQVFAATLEKPTVEAEFEPDRYAHIFTAPVTPSYTVTLKNSSDRPQDVRLNVTTLSHDEAEKTAQEQKVRVPANGILMAKFTLPLKKYGYHQVTLTIHDEQGERTRQRSLAYLHADTRERGDWADGKGVIYGFWDWNGGHLTPSGMSRLEIALQAGCESTMHSYEGMAYADHPTTPPEEKEFLARHQFASHFLAYQFSPSKENLGGLEWDPSKPDVMAKAVVDTVKKSAAAQATAINQPNLAVFLAEPIVGNISVASLPEYFNEPPYVMGADEQAAYKKYLDWLVIAGGAIKKAWPNAKVCFPWGIPNFPIAFLRNSKEAAAIMDGPAVDMAPFEREPELQMGQVTLQNEMWQLKEEWKKHTNRPFPLMCTVEGPGCSPAVPGGLTQDGEAQIYTRTFLSLMAYNVNEILGGPVLSNCAGAWGEQHYGGGLSEAIPDLSPHVGYSAFATLTRHINRVNYVKAVPTGSNSVYCLQFKHYKTGELVHVMWTLRGKRPVTLSVADGANVQVFDSMDNPVAITGAGGKATFTITALPSFVHGLTGDAVVGLGTPDHSDAAPPAGKLAAKLGNLGDGSWTMSNERNEYFEKAHYEFVRHFPGVMNAMPVEAPKAAGGKALAIHLGKQEIERFVMPYYTMLTPAKPIVIDGKARQLGLWVKGASDWGRVIYFLRDAKGEPWISVGTKDQWNCDDTRAWSQFCFDGWRYLRFELPANAPWDCFREEGSTWWGQPEGTGDGIVDLPLRVEKIAVERRTHVLYVTDLVPADPSDVLLGDLYAEYASPEDRSEHVVEVSKVRMPQATATVEAAPNPIARLEKEGVGAAVEITKVQAPAQEYDGRRCNVFFNTSTNAVSYDLWVSRSPDGRDALHAGTGWTESGKLLTGLSANTDLYLFVSYLDKDGKASKPSKAFKVNLKDMFPMK